MRNSILQATVLTTLAFSASQAMATGFVTLPTSGTTPYVGCQTASNFGSVNDTSLPSASDNACVATNGLGVALALNSAPESGFTLQNSNSGAITAFSETVATLNERTFRNSGTGQCIYAKQVLMSSTATHDYNPQKAGTQTLEVNDFAFGGYTGAVSVAYSKVANNHASVYRAGRTFTSVQMQAQAGAPGSVAAGYLVLPTAGGTVGTEINGVGQTLTPPGSPTAAQQQAPFSANWVDFTTDASGTADEDGYPNLNSPTMYIQQACANATVSVVANSMKLRQTGQETQPWVTITTSSHAPSSTITP